MKILYATDNFPPPSSGHAIAVINMALEMKNRGHNVIIIAPSTAGYKNFSRNLSEVPDISKDDNPAAITVFYLRSIPFFKGDNALKSLAVSKNYIEQIISDFKPDIVHYNGWGPLCKRVFKTQTRKNSIRTVATCHGVPMHVTSKLFGRNITFGGLEKIIWKLMVKFYGRMEFVISPSNFVNDRLLVAGLDREKGLVISNGIDIKEYNRHKEIKRRDIYRKYKLPPDKTFITYIGRIDPEKNIQVIIKTADYYQNNENIVFIVAGAGQLKNKLESAIRKNNYKIILFDWLKHDELVDILGISDIFFIPSPSESQSITTLEAMASYLPVVATDEGALPDLVKDNVNGFLFKNNDPVSCIEKLNILINDNRLIKTFGLKSRERVLPHDRKNVMSRLEDVYKLKQGEKDV